MGDVHIRAGQLEDAAAIHAMLASLAEELGFGAAFASTEASIRRHGFGARALFSTLIAQAAEPVGLALYFPHFSTTRAQPGAYVQDLWTAPRVRGRGVGAALLTAVAKMSARDWGAAYLALTVHNHNEAGGRFYTKLGFESTTGEQPVTLGGQSFAALSGSGEVIP